MRVLALPKYGPLGGSSRLRTFQYLPKLREAGLSVDVVPLLEDAYVRALYAERNRTAVVMRGYAGRLRDILSARKYDLVWTEKELLPWSPALMELGLFPKRMPLVVDIDDALFHRYDRHRNMAVRAVLGTKIDRVMRRATVVLAGNNYLAERARSAGCTRVEWLPTVVDADRYSSTGKSKSSDGPLTVGWIGSPATAHYLRAVAAPLSDLAARGVIRCIAIGARPDQVAGTPFEARPWSEESEVAQLGSLDVGIMPLPDEPWEQGKCGYKIIQYMACGLPVVASPVGVNSTLITPGENGFLARTGDEWKDAVMHFVERRDLRESMGQSGRAKVEAIYSVQTQLPRLLRFLHEAAGSPH